MLKWIQGGISAVTGLAEPEYGSEYIHPCTERVRGKQPFNETKKADFEWQTPDHTNVETSTFYFTDLDSGYTGFAQVIHSNIIGLHTTAQFTFKVYHSERLDEQLWTSVKLENFRIEGTNFYADNLSIEMNEEGTQVHVKSTVSEDVTVDFTIKKIVSGVKVGENPITYYGDDVEQPWGTMRHVFWPRNQLSGILRAKNEETGVNINLEFANEKHNYSMFVMAIQGMKPHHAAKSWNFLNYQSETHSAVLMEYTTPKSYANTKVSIGIICSHDSVLAVTIDNDVQHLNAEIDSVGWPIPKEIAISFSGVPSTAKEEELATVAPFAAAARGSLEHLVERVDVMAEIPTFVKNIVSGVVGTKPYIYQFFDKFTLEVAGQSSTGYGWCEVTFISEAGAELPLNDEE